MPTQASRARICRHAGRFPGYWSMPGPEKRDWGALLRVVLALIHAKMAQEAFWVGVHWKLRNGSLGRSARGNEGDLRKRPSLQRPPRRQRCPDSGPGPLPGKDLALVDQVRPPDPESGYRAAGPAGPEWRFCMTRKEDPTTQAAAMLHLALRAILRSGQDQCFDPRKRTDRLDPPDTSDRQTPRKASTSQIQAALCADPAGKLGSLPKPFNIAH